MQAHVQIGYTRNQPVRHLGLDVHRKAILTDRRSYIEDVEDGGDVDKQPSFSKVPPRADPARNLSVSTNVRCEE